MNPSFLTMDDCLYCLTPVRRPADEDAPAVCPTCVEDQKAFDDYRRMKAEFDRKYAGTLLGVDCRGCGDYIPRRVWSGDKPPKKCYICASGEKHREFAAEMKKWREEDAAAAPYIIEAMRAAFGVK